jgi:hypothetical protein
MQEAPAVRAVLSQIVLSTVAEVGRTAAFDAIRA